MIQQSDKAFAAFSLYLSPGPGRSLSAVAAKLGKGWRDADGPDGDIIFLRSGPEPDTQPVLPLHQPRF